jgi:hypothetical protein
VKWIIIIWLNLVLGLLLINKLKPIEVPVYVDKQQIVEKIKEVPLKLEKISLRKMSSEEVVQIGGQEGMLVYEVKGRIGQVAKKNDTTYFIVVEK